MNTYSETFDPTIAYDLSKLGDPEDILFFDIETTGLSAARDRIYLIGCVFLSEGEWVLKQWFADSLQSEKEILLHFLVFSSRYPILVHFNGDTFDIPFVNARAKTAGLSLSLSPLMSFDLYKHLRPFKRMLSLPDCRLKSLERVLGIYREDPYTGGELIAHYDTYCRTKDPALLKELLLHNAEDLKNLPKLMDLLVYEDISGESFIFDRAEESTYYSLDKRTPNREVFLHFHMSSLILPAPFTIQKEEFYLKLSGSKGILRVPLCEGCLKLFFDNYKDYYYLPAEDMAMHKSVAEFVDKSARKKATARTCYQNKQGTFLPLPKGFQPGDTHSFREEYRGKKAYVLYAPSLLGQSGFLSGFILALINN